jgi:hypothetical protein
MTNANRRADKTRAPSRSDDAMGAAPLYETTVFSNVCPAATNHGKMIQPLRGTKFDKDESKRLLEKNKIPSIRRVSKAICQRKPGANSAFSVF